MMEDQRVYVINNKAAITCPKCGITKLVDTRRVKNRYIPFPVRCPCGSNFRVFFEKRRCFRKEVQLTGKYRKEDSAEALPMIVRNLSRQGVGFQVLTKDLKEADEAGKIECGDFLYIDFTLNNASSTLIRGKVVVRNISKGYIGAEFFQPDEHVKKELGFFFLK